MNWYIKVLKQYADFNGRARREEYWVFLLFYVIFAIVALLLDNILDIAIKPLGYGPLYAIYILALFIPGLAVSARRLHDIGKSGRMLLIGLIPVIGFFWLLVLMVRKGEEGENLYGFNPKD